VGGKKRHFSRRQFTGRAGVPRTPLEPMFRILCKGGGEESIRMIALQKGEGRDCWGGGIRRCGEKGWCFNRHQVGGGGGGGIRGSLPIVVNLGRQCGGGETARNGHKTDRRF